MKTITQIRAGLSQIPGALLDFPPEGSYRRPEAGVEVETLSRGLGDESLMPANRVDYLYSDGLLDPGHLLTDFDPLIEIGPEIEEAMAAFDGEAGEQIRKSVELHGVDALGWYSSFHIIGAQWGVYISASGIGYLMHEAFAGLPIGLETKAHLAFHAILNHELFHFATDFCVSQAELLNEEPWWGTAKKAFRDGDPDYCTQEEKLANAYMLKAFRTMKPELRVRGKQEALKQFVMLQPEGYRDGIHVAGEGWETNLAELAQCYRQHSQHGSEHPLLDEWGGFDWARQFPIVPRIDWRYCPIHLVDDGDRLGIPGSYLSFFSRLEGIVESAPFLRKLSKLGARIQEAWAMTKARLETAITAGADFKKWPKDGQDVWSVRVTQSIRAHLRREITGDWTALTIGSHKEMGHG